MRAQNCPTVRWPFNRAATGLVQPMGAKLHCQHRRCHASSPLLKCVLQHEQLHTGVEPGALGFSRTTLSQSYADSRRF